MSEYKVIETKTVTEKCTRCQGRGDFWWGGMVNGNPMYSGVCFKCHGAGKVEVKKHPLCPPYKQRKVCASTEPMHMVFNVEKSRLELRSGSNVLSWVKAKPGSDLSNVSAQLEKRAVFLNEVRAMNDLPPLPLNKDASKLPQPLSPIQVLATFIEQGLEVSKDVVQAFADDLRHNRLTLADEQGASADKAAEIVVKVASADSLSSVFDHKVRGLCNNAQVHPSEYATVVYAITVARDIDKRKAEIAARAQASEWVANEGDKIQIEFEVGNVRHFDGGFRSGQMTVYYYGKTPEGQEVVVRSTTGGLSKEVTPPGGQTTWRVLGVGDRITLKGTVRECGEWQGVKQTQLFRAKIVEFQ